MTRKQTQLAERRHRLVTQAAAQRADWARDIAPWRPRLAVVDRGVSVLRFIARTPVLLLGVALALAVWRPQRLGAWVQRGLMVWQLARRLAARSVTGNMNNDTSPRTIDTLMQRSRT